MVVGLEYSDLPEVVPQSSASPMEMGRPGGPSSPYNTLISPLSTYSEPAAAGGLDPRRAQKHAAPWSPDSLESLNPRLSGLPPPYDPRPSFDGPPPPSPAPSQMSHVPLHDVPGPYGYGGGYGYGYSRPGTAGPFDSTSAIVPPGTAGAGGMAVGGGAGLGGTGSPMGPVAVARRRRRRRWMICGCLCAVAVLIALALGVGAATGWIHWRWSGDGVGVSDGGQSRRSTTALSESGSWDRGLSQDGKSRRGVATGLDGLVGAIADAVG